MQELDHHQVSPGTSTGPIFAIDGGAELDTVLHHSTSLIFRSQWGGIETRAGGVDHGVHAGGDDGNHHHLDHARLGGSGARQRGQHGALRAPRTASLARGTSGSSWYTS